MTAAKREAASRTSDTAQPPSAATTRLPRKGDKIFDVALRQLSDKGYDALTIEGIAQEAEVNKTTLYRWWSGKDELLSAALRHGELLQITVPDTGSLRGDLIDVLGQISALLESPYTRALIAVVIGGGRPGLEHLATEFVHDRLLRHGEVVAHAKARREIPAATTGTDLFHPLIGALWIRVLLLSQYADDDYLADLVDHFLAGFVVTSETGHDQGPPDAGRSARP
ncbi:TetR/AcrR family transcriptional regulator [Tsukamurella serpentis]